MADILCFISGINNRDTALTENGPSGVFPEGPSCCFRFRAAARFSARGRAASRSLRSVELAGGKVAAEQVAEGQAVDAVAVAGNREVVGIRVHVADHGAHVE